VDTGWTIGLLADFDEEPPIEFHPPGILIAIDEENVRALPRNYGSNRIIQLAEQRIRDAEATGTGPDSEPGRALIMCQA
jgi:hypothetical protein